LVDSSEMSSVDLTDSGTIDLTLEAIGDPQSIEGVFCGSRSFRVRNGRGIIGEIGKSQHPMAQAYICHARGPYGYPINSGQRQFRT